MKTLKTHQWAILVAALVSVVGWAVPFVAKLLLPLTYLNTVLHETCHAIAGSLTGAAVEQITVRADGSGVTPMAGGNLWLIGPAGYMGATMIGAAIIWFSRSERGAHNTLRVLTLLLFCSLILWVRADLIGVIAAIGWVVALGAASLLIKGEAAIFVAQFIGLQQCLNSITAVYVLLNISAAAPDTGSDARIMQLHSGIPAFIWAFGWCAFSLALVAVSLRRAWSPPSRRSASGRAGSPGSGPTIPGDPGSR